jgi:ferredoxin-NADP reductase
MYRVVLYGLWLMAGYSIILGVFGIISYNPTQLVLSLFILLIVCFLINWLISTLIGAHVNVESWMITGLILYFLFMPAAGYADILTLVFAGAIAMVSKYLLAINKKHIFNPAALAAVALSLNPETVALWWVGSSVMLPAILTVGLLVVRKIRKFSMLFAFIGASFLGTYVFGLFTNNLSFELFIQLVLSGPLVFLGTIMLTEPLTTPPRKKFQLVYAVVVGFLFTNQFNIGSLYSSPELALVIGNIFSYIVSPKYKLFMYFKEKREIAKDIYEFIFETSGRYGKSFGHKAGQYMEWTLAHQGPDARGVRRYFTFASSPTENEARVGVRIDKRASTYKNKLRELKKGDLIIGAQPGGDFVLPDDKEKKIAFIAGGVGITPFRSMIKYLIDKNETRDIVLLYFNKTEDEIAYKDIFEIGKKIGVKVIYVLTDIEKIPNGWMGESGRLDKKMLEKVAQDYRERVFYLSGSEGLVNNYRRVLLAAGIGRPRIKTDYFSGY